MVLNYNILSLIDRMEFTTTVPHSTVSSPPLSSVHGTSAQVTQESYMTPEPVPTPATPPPLERIDDEAFEAVQNIDTSETIDTTDVAAVREFIHYLNTYEPDENSEDSMIQILLRRLPQINSAVGKSHSVLRLMKALRIASPQIPAMVQFGAKTYSMLTRMEKSAFHAVAKVAESTLATFTTMRAAVLVPFSKIVPSQPAVFVAGDRVRMIDKYAFITLTTANQASVADLEKLHDRTPEADRTAFLDQPGGAKEFTRKLFDNLIEVGLGLRSRGEMAIDRYIGEAHVGDDAAALFDAMKIEPEPPKDGEEFKKLYTQLLNLHDGLITRSDHSGGNVTGVERRVKAFDSFIGNSGRSKNLGLFFCMLVWEGEQTRFTSRALPDWLTADSGNDNGGPPPRNPKTAKEIEEEKRLKNLGDLAQLLNPPKTPEDNNARDLLLIEKTKSERQSKLSRMGEFLESPAFNSLEEDVRVRCKRKFQDSVVDMFNTL